MKRKNIRELALILLDRYEAGGSYVNLSLNSHITDGLSREERAHLTRLLYTTVERKLTYDYYAASLAGRALSDIDPHTLNIIRLGMCGILHTRTADYAAVNETVALAGGPGERGFVNAILRATVKRKEEGTLPMPPREKNAARHISVKHSFPLPTVKRFIEILGEEECEELLSVFNSERPTDITVNTRKISREELMKELSERGLKVTPSERSRLSLRIEGSIDPTGLPGFDEGHFFVQDEVCALSAEALGTKEGDSVVDVCASPGGKSFAAAILAGDMGRVKSFDLHEGRVSLILGGAARLGLEKTIEAEARDATNPDKTLVESFDRVICDVPCSGLGVLGKKPDLRYGREYSAELPALQLEIAEASLSYLSPGGVMVYSTCSIDPRENEEVVRELLSRHPELSPIDFKAGDLESTNGMLTTYPHRHGCDGFFIAKLKKA